MARRDDFTEELDPADLPPPSSEGGKTQIVDLDELGGPTEMMDRRALLGSLPWGDATRAAPLIHDRDSFHDDLDESPHTVAAADLDPRTVPGGVVAIGGDEDDSPNSERTLFGSITAESTALPQHGDAGAFAQESTNVSSRGLHSTAEHTMTMASPVTPGSQPPAPSQPPRRPPPPPSRQSAPVPAPRRPHGLPPPASFRSGGATNPFVAQRAPAPLGADATQHSVPNPFQPPPSKFFQAPTGPGRSKPRESTVDLDLADLPDSDLLVDEPESHGSIQRGLDAIPGRAPAPPSYHPPSHAPVSAPLSAPVSLEAPSMDAAGLASAEPSVDFEERLAESLQAASNLLVHVGDPERSFFAYLDILAAAPSSAEAAIGIERAAHELGVHAKSKWSEAARRLKKTSDAATDVALRTEYLALLFRWNNQELRRRDVAAEVLVRLTEIAPRHPVVLERKANEARARGDASQQKQLLLEALPLTIRTDDRIRMHLALAELFEGPLAARGKALPHYQAVLEELPDHFDALRGLERAMRDANDAQGLRDVLERLVAAATTPKDRLEVLIRLAETLEKDLGDPDSAASALEEALLVDPEHAKGLAALERCREALGQWSEVARTMQRRADVLTAPRAKLDLLFAACDVLEARAGDLEGAVESYQAALRVDGKNRRALGELRRLCDQLGLVDEALSYGTRLAEATPDKREGARIYAELGQELEDRSDLHLARTQYERALELDRRSRPVLAALERIARNLGADERARHFLEQRAKLTDDKLEASELYAQLGRERREADDHEGSLAAYGAALHADPTSEEAAGALLDWHVDQGNFRAVEPLLELLTGAARRDHDAPRTLHLLRLATRTAASLGKIEHALHAAMAAFDEAPTDAGARSDLLEVATRTSPDKIGIARDHLARVAESADDLSTGVLVRLAEAQYAAGDSRRAIATLEQAHDQTPNDTEPLEVLGSIFENEQMWERLAVIKVEHARMLPLADEELHFRLLADAGDIWARRLNDVRAASEAFEEARVLRPDDSWLLETLAWAFREVEEWDKLVEVLETLLASAESPEKSRELLLELGALQSGELKNPTGAAAVLDRVLDADPSYLKAFEDLVRLLTDQRDWAGLEKAYRKMLLRASQGGASKSGLELALWKQLGLVYRDRLGNNKNALEAFQAALHRAPADEELHRIVVELALILGDLDGAILQARKRVQFAPFEPATYSTLYDLFLRKGNYDLAWCALDVMAQLAGLEGEEDELYSGYPPFPLDEIPGTLTEEAWQTHLLDRDMDPTLTSLFAWSTPAEVRLLERSHQYLGLHPFDQSAGGQVAALTAIIENGAEILGMVNPPLYHTESSRMPLRPAASPPGAFLVDPTRATDESETIAFHVGRGLSWLRSELMPLAFFADPNELAGFLARLVRQDPDVYFAMTEEERGTVQLIIDQATADNAKLDVRKWVILAHASSVRAAVLLSGSVHDAAVFYSRAEDDEHASEKLTAIYQFAVSDEHNELRTAIGTAISQTA